MLKGFKLTCKIQKEDNHYSLKLPEDYQKAMHFLMEHCFEKKGGYCSFEISPPKRKRSTGKNSQGNHFNGHCQTIAESTGQPFNSVKEYIKSQAITRGYPMLLDDKGNPILDNYGHNFGISEAVCTVEECNLLIDEVHQFADENNIKLDEGNNNV